MRVGVVVVGIHTSSHVMKCARLPTPGEYLIAEEYRKIQDGGKASNQALAAARLGATPYLVARVGNDDEGESARRYLDENNVNVEYVTISRSRPTGFGVAFMDQNGQPMGATELGANTEFSAAHVDRALPAFKISSVVMTQHEIPFDLAMYACRTGKSNGLTVIFNPAPADGVIASRLTDVDVLTPNEPEAKVIAGYAPDQDVPVETVGKALYRMIGTKRIVVTLGENGVLLVKDGVPSRVACPKVTAVDTTGAGDCFNAAMAVALGSGASIEAAVAFGARVATMSVTRPEAWPSFPTSAEIYERHGRLW